MLRRQLPAYSPLTLAGLAAGLRGRGAHSSPRERLSATLAERYGAGRVILTGSGTEALTLALRGSARADRRPVVALPAYACYDVVTAAVGADARIAFYDVDPLTLAPDTASLVEVCGLEPDAVVVAPLYGIPVDWDAVHEIVAPHGSLLVEDAAQGLGATWRGQPLGSLGDVSVLSFGRGKGWTGGAGGALLDRTPEGRMAAPSAPAASDLSVAAHAGAQWLLGRPSMYWLPASLPWLALGETEYHEPVEPRAMPGLAAALVLAHEDEARRESEIRMRNAVELLEELVSSAGSRSVTTVRPPRGGDAGYLRLPVLVPGGVSAFKNPESAQASGVMPGYPRALPELPAARERTLAGPPTPGAMRLAGDLVTLPTHRLLGTAEKKLLVKTLAVPDAATRSAQPEG